MPENDLPLHDRRRLEALKRRFEAYSESFLGYPCTLRFDYSPLYDFLGFTLNNVGDPYIDTTFKLNTHEFEVEVLAWFSDLLGAEATETWGYITNGGTEGNMYGLYLARELYPDAILYYSQDTHYSVAKIARLLRLRSIMIKRGPNGEIDYEDLRETLRVHRDVPPVLLANIGTTMRGAVDDTLRIRSIIDDLAIPHSYLHADAALSGMILPFVDGAPRFGFDAGVDSVAISGHKMVGSPIPCGIVLARRRHVERIARAVEYIGTLDTTLAGSRNAITPLFLWYAIRSIGKAGFRRIIADCLDTAEYAVGALRAVGIDAWRNAHSVIVVLPRPPDGIVSRWQLAVEGDIAHIVTMPHVTRQRVDRFVDDLIHAPAVA